MLCLMESTRLISKTFRRLPNPYCAIALFAISRLKQKESALMISSKNFSSDVGLFDDKVGNGQYSSVVRRCVLPQRAPGCATCRVSGSQIKCRITAGA